MFLFCECHCGPPGAAVCLYVWVRPGHINDIRWSHTPSAWVEEIPSTYSLVTTASDLRSGHVMFLTVPQINNQLYASHRPVVLGPSLIQHEMEEEEEDTSPSSLTKMDAQAAGKALLFFPPYSIAAVHTATGPSESQISGRRRRHGLGGEIGDGFGEAEGDGDLGFDPGQDTFGILVQLTLHPTVIYLNDLVVRQGDDMLCHDAAV